MTDDIRASASLDLGNALSGLQKLTKGLNDMTVATKQLQAMQVNLQQKTQGVYGEIGKVAGRVAGGGPFKELFDQVGKGEPVFARLTAGLVLAAVAFKAYEMVTQNNIIKAQAYVEAQRQVIEVNQKVRDSQDKIAQAGASQNTAGYRALVATAGVGALDRAKKLEATGDFNRNESIDVTSAVYGRFGNTMDAYRSFDNIKEAVRYGMDPREYTKKITALPALSKSALDMTLGLSLIQRNHSVGISPSEALEDARRRSGADEYHDAIAKQAEIRSGIDPAERQNSILFGTRQAGQDLANATNPGIEEQRAFYAQTLQKQNELIAAANAQGVFLGSVVDLLGGISAEKQLGLFNEANTAAAGIPKAAPAPAPPLSFSQLNARYYGD